jgi:hypothetical protein
VDSIIGFTLLHDLHSEPAKAALAAQRRVLSPFRHLSAKTLEIGESRLEVWGHGNLSARLHCLDDGTMLALVGSPHGRVARTDWPAGHGLDRLQDAQLPWDGRFVLLRISADGRHWIMWNDWAGSILVFHARVNGARIAGTLEPVVAAATSPSVSHLNLPGLVSLLINGHTLADWTLSTRVRVIPPDSVLEWDDRGFRSTPRATIGPTEDLRDAPWNELIERMYGLSRQAIAETFSGSSSWVVPLSAGLDSRLIAATAADLGVPVRTYAWGSGDTVDVVYSREIASTLRLPWAHVALGSDYLARYTSRWAEWFGTTLHAHGMYQMAFLDAVGGTAGGPIATGFLGDILSASPLFIEGDPLRGQLYGPWHTHWTLEELKTLLRAPVHEALEVVRAEIDTLAGTIPGSSFKKAMLAEIWSRQRIYTSFQSTLSDYWRGTGTPFLNRAYARFCFALPRTALERKRLLGDVFCRYHPRVAAIPGTYGPEPLIRTGRYLLKRRLALGLPSSLRLGPLKGFRDVPPRMDIECVQAHGWKALWPLDAARGLLDEWLDTTQLDVAYNEAMSSTADIRPLRRLQSPQTFAWWLLQQDGLTPDHLP